MEDQQQRYERARARVQAIKGFYIHASVFGFAGDGPWGRDWEKRKAKEMMGEEGGS
jgi:hypothetical protein